MDVLKVGHLVDWMFAYLVACLALPKVACSDFAMASSSGRILVECWAVYWVY